MAVSRNNPFSPPCFLDHRPHLLEGKLLVHRMVQLAQYAARSTDLDQLRSCAELITHSLQAFRNPIAEHAQPPCFPNMNYKIDRERMDVAVSTRLAEGRT